MSFRYKQFHWIVAAMTFGGVHGQMDWAWGNELAAAETSATVVVAETKAPVSAYWEKDLRLHPYLAPFLTNAEIVEYLGDKAGRIDHKGGPCTIHLPGIKSVTFMNETGAVVSSEMVKKEKSELIYKLPAGKYTVQIETDGAPGVFAAGLLPVSAEEAAKITTVIAAVQPGQEIVLPPGIYSNVKWAFRTSGTEAAPIVMRPQIPGTVVIRGNSAISIYASWIAIQGLCFDNAGPESTVSIENGSHNRITQCQFFFCGNSLATYGRIIDFRSGAAENRLDHCYFTGSKSQSSGQLVTGPKETGQLNRFDHNIFRNINRLWNNGQECVQIGQKHEYIHTEPRARVESNLFENAAADVEIVSNKSTANKYESNLIAYCPDGALSLRAGQRAEVIGNLFIHTGNGVSVRGSGHVIRHNLVWEPEQSGIRLGAGGDHTAITEAANRVQVEENLIVYAQRYGIFLEASGPKGPLTAHECMISKNVVFSVDEKDALKGFSPEDKNQLVDNQVLVAKNVEADATAGEPGSFLKALIEASDDSHAKKIPLQFLQFPSQPGVDLGTAFAACPPLPPKRVWSTNELRGEKIALESAGGFDAGSMKLSSAKAKLPAVLPDEFVMEWTYRPENWAAIASVTLASGADEVKVQWGGLDAKGKRPKGIVEISRKDAPLVTTQCPDIVNHGQDFKSKHPPTATQMREYRFRLIKTKTLLRVEMVRWDSEHEQYGGEGFTPMAIWENEVLAGSTPWSAELAQSGNGSWSNINLWKLK